MDLVVLIVAALAAHRLTQLVHWDSVWAPTRDRLLDWLQARDGTLRVPVQMADGSEETHEYAPQRRMVGQFIAWKIQGALLCGFCTGWWVSIAVGLVGLGVQGWPGVWESLLFVAAVAGAQSMLWRWFLDE